MRRALLDRIDRHLARNEALMDRLDATLDRNTEAFAGLHQFMRDERIRRDRALEQHTRALERHTGALRLLTEEILETRKRTVAAWDDVSHALASLTKGVHDMMRRLPPEGEAG